MFGLDSALLVTQGFHLPRALFVCNALGLKAEGVMAANRRYWPVMSLIWNVREQFATVAALVDVYVSRPQPILGEPQPMFGRPQASLGVAGRPWTPKGKGNDHASRRGAGAGARVRQERGPGAPHAVRRGVHAAVRARSSARTWRAWGELGLIHDFDWEIHPTLEEHPSKGAPDPARARGCRGHHPGHPEPRHRHRRATRHARRKALYACDEITGIGDGGGAGAALAVAL